MLLHSGFDYFMRMPISDLTATVKEAIQIVKKR